MTKRLVIRSDAHADMAEAAVWYEQQGAGLGHDFLAKVDSVFRLISKNPTIFPITHRQARLAPLKRFPYIVIYRVFAEHISVVAVLHGARDPASWKERLN